MASLTLSSCSSTYTGRVITSDGRLVGAASIQALGYPSLLSATPWNWYPAVYVRGATNTLRDGSFSLRASQYHIEELQVRSKEGSANVRHPTPKQSITITVQPHSRTFESLIHPRRMKDND